MVVFENGSSSTLLDEHWSPIQRSGRQMVEHIHRRRNNTVYKTPRDSSCDSSSHYFSGDDECSLRSAPERRQFEHLIEKSFKKNEQKVRRRNRSRVSFKYMDRTSKSAVECKNKLHTRQRRSTSIEVKYEPVLPPPAETLPICTSPHKIRVQAKPCHTNWDQAYEPKRCDSSESSRDLAVAPPCCLNKSTTVYCPVMKENSSEENTSVFKKLSRGYTEDKVLKTQVTIMEKHRQYEESQQEYDQQVPAIVVQKSKSSSGILIHQTSNFDKNMRNNPSDEIPNNSHSFDTSSRPFSSKADRLKAARLSMGLPEVHPEDNEHTFPFGQTMSGNVRVKPEQIAFESKMVAVLISEPQKTRVNVKQEVKRPGPPTIICELQKTRVDLKQEEKRPVPPTIPILPTDNDASEDDKNDSTQKISQSSKKIQLPPPKYYQNENYETREQLIKKENLECQCNDRQLPELVDAMVQTLDFEFDGSKQVTDEHRLQIKSKQIYGGHSEDDCEGVKDFMDNIHYRMKRAINPDTTIFVEGKEFPCHSIALQCYSKYFDKKHRHRDKMLEIEIPDKIITAKEFRNLMDWILISESDKKLVISKENVVGLYSGSIYLDIPALRHDCSEFVRTKLKEEDPAILKMYEQACQKENCQALVSLLSTKLSSLFLKLYKSTQFLNMDVKELVVLLNSDTIKIKSELDVYDAAARWLLFDWKTRQVHTIEVMRTVRFGLLTPLQLTQIRHFADSPEMSDYANIYSYDQVKKFLADGLSYAIFRENFKDRPGELNRWVGISEVKAPNLRYNMDYEPDLNRMPAPIFFQDDEYENPVQFETSTTRKMSGSKQTANGSEQTANGSEQTAKVSKKETHVSQGTTHEESNISQKNEDSLTTFGKKPIVKLKKYFGSFKNLKLRGNQSNQSRADERIQAAIVIQSYVRSWLTRRWFKHILYAVICIQVWYRARRLRMHRRKMYTPVNVMKSTKHLAYQKHSMTNTPGVPKLTLEHSTVFIIFGGHDPSQNINSNNSAKDIYQLDLTTNIWTFMGNLPEPRIHSGVVRNAGMVIFFGGADPRHRNSKDKLIPSPTTWCIDTETGGKWKKLADMQIGRRNFGYATSSGKIYVFGGVDDDGKTLSSCEAYDPDYNSWSFIQPMDAPRTCMGVIKHDGLIWIAGGMSKFQEYPLLKSVITYNVKQNKFSPAISLPHAICHLTMASYQGQLFLIGGAGKIKGTEKTQSLSTILSLIGGEWKVISELQTPRHGHCQLNMGKYIGLVGGINSFEMSALDSCEIFNMEKGTVRSRMNPMPKKLSGLCGVVLL